MADSILSKKLQLAGFVIALLLSVDCQGSERSLFKNLLKLAEAGSAQAQYNVGMALNNGIGTKKDAKEALNWFQKAAAGGDPLGAYKVGCYYGGQFGVVAVDHEKALQYKLVAATAGYSLAEHDVGIIYFQRDQFTEALHWWQRSAEQGYPSALYNLSVAYHEGKVIPKDAMLAYAYFKLAKSVSEPQMDDVKAESILNELRVGMSASDVEKAELVIAQWGAQPTPLTLRAAAGMEEARNLVRAQER